MTQMKTNFIVLCFSMLSLSISAGNNPVTPLIYIGAKNNVPWNAATMSPDFEEPIEISAFTTDPVLTRVAFFSDQKYTDKRLLGWGTKLPAYMDGREFYMLRSDREHTFHCTKSGDIIGVAFASDKAAVKAMKKQGFAERDTLEVSEIFDKFPDRNLSIMTRSIKAGERIVMPKFTLLAGIAVENTATGEVLYNNIVIPRQWPPQREVRPDNPQPVPYLKNRPDVVPIDIGRQLFVDDFLIENTTLTREFHYPEKYEGNPVLKPETELEKKSRYGDRPVAAPLGGSIWWSHEKQVYEIWYEAGHVTNLAYATSKDGLKWERPVLDIFPGTNKIIEQEPDSWSVVLDYWETNPQERYKMLLRGPNENTRRVRAYTSPDGIHWDDRGWGGYAGDRVTFFYNPFRKKWVYSLRWYLPDLKLGRSRGYLEADDFLLGSKWTPTAPVFWASTDKLDKHFDDGIPENDNQSVELYNMDTCAYESILISFFQLFYGPENAYWAERGIGKLTALNFAYSRDGFHWDRPDRTLAIKSTQKYGDWDCGYVQSVGNLMAIRGDKLLIYYTGFAGDTSRPWDPKAEGGILNSAMHDNGAMGVAFLRRDGFASMNTPDEGILTTRPVVFTGKNLFVNVNADKGELVAQVADMDGKPIAPFTFENSESIRNNTTIAQMKWKGGSDLSVLANKPVRFEFKLEKGKLYAFWVSRDESGRSDGYVAGGGPGFTSNIDTRGKKAYEADADFSKQLKP